jgi:methyl-accepting chemotaxis protein
LSYEASQTTEIPQTTTKKPIESNSTEKVVEGIEELIDCQLGELSQNFTASLRDTKMAVEGVKQELSDLKTSVETNNQNMREIQECCTSNQKAVEDLATKVFKKTVETQLKGLEEKLTRMVQEKLDALQDRLENGGG